MICLIANISGEKVEIDDEARKALNFIETVIQLHTRIFTWCLQPMKSAIIRIFPYVNSFFFHFKNSFKDICFFSSFAN